MELKAPWLTSESHLTFLKEMDKFKRNPRTFRDAAMIILNELNNVKLKTSMSGWPSANLEDLYDRGEVVLLARLALTDVLEFDKLHEIGDLLDHKQRAYGPRNILKFGHEGLAVRLWDKMARHSNLRVKDEYWFESLHDTKLDIVGYTVIIIMLHKGWFELPLDPQLDFDGEF